MSPWCTMTDVLQLALTEYTIHTTHHSMIVVYVNILVEHVNAVAVL